MARNRNRNVEPETTDCPSEDVTIDYEPEVTPIESDPVEGIVPEPEQTSLPGTDDNEVKRLTVEEQSALLAEWTRLGEELAAQAQRHAEEKAELVDRRRAVSSDLGYARGGKSFRRKSDGAEVKFVKPRKGDGYVIRISGAKTIEDEL